MNTSTGTRIRLSLVLIFELLVASVLSIDYAIDTTLNINKVLGLD